MKKCARILTPEIDVQADSFIHVTINRETKLAIDASHFAAHTCHPPPCMNSEMSKKSRPADSIDFEKSLTELEQIVERLELGELSLDESLKQFERGIALTRSCQHSLQQAEQKVEILMRQHGTAEPLDTAPFTAAEDEA